MGVHQQQHIILGAMEDLVGQLSLHGTMVAMEGGQQHPQVLDHTPQMDISLHGAAGVHHHLQDHLQDHHQVLLHPHLQEIEVQVFIFML